MLSAVRASKGRFSEVETSLPVFPTPSLHRGFCPGSLPSRSTLCSPVSSVVKVLVFICHAERSEIVQRTILRSRSIPTRLHDAKPAQRFLSRKPALSLYPVIPGVLCGKGFGFS